MFVFEQRSTRVPLAIYDYTDEHGNLLFQVHRKDGTFLSGALRSEIEANPEKYPNVILRKAREGRSTLVFLKRVPKPVSQVSQAKSPKPK